jgi:hypothetical protein
MPAFLVPVFESNDCHNPEGPGGGQFCSDAVATLLKKYTSDMEDAADISNMSRRLITGDAYVDQQFRAANLARWRAEMQTQFKKTDAEIDALIEKESQRRRQEAEMVRPLVEAIRHAPDADMPLYRAVYTSWRVETLNALKPGDEVSLDRVTSFSLSREVASQFAMTPQSIDAGTTDPDRMMHPSDAKDYDNYQFILEGAHKSLDVTPHSRYGEQERVTHGTFVVVRVDGPSVVAYDWLGQKVNTPYKRTITLRQVATY